MLINFFIIILFSGILLSPIIRTLRKINGILSIRYIKFECHVTLFLLAPRPLLPPLVREPTVVDGAAVSHWKKSHCVSGSDLLPAGREQTQNFLPRVGPVFLTVLRVAGSLCLRQSGGLGGPEKSVLHSGLS